MNRRTTPSDPALHSSECFYLAQFMSALIENHYGPHYHTVTLQGRSARSAVWTKPRDLHRVQNHCLQQHVQTAVREQAVTVHYIWALRQSEADTHTETLHKTVFTETGRPRMRQMKWCKLNIPHTIQSRGVGVFIKEMTDHNISLIGLNRNATTILQITPWWGKCN